MTETETVKVSPALMSAFDADTISKADAADTRTTGIQHKSIAIVHIIDIIFTKVVFAGNQPL